MVKVGQDTRVWVIQDDASVSGRSLTKTLDVRGQWWTKWSSSQKGRTEWIEQQETQWQRMEVRERLNGAGKVQ